MFGRDDTTKKPSLFSRLTGTSSDGDYIEDGPEREQASHLSVKSTDWDDKEADGELGVDVYQTQDAIVVKAFIAGVQLGSLDISLSREMITITGSRTDEKEVDEDDYFQKELYWGSFSRTILLPEEVDVDLAEASEKHGILVIRLPKINKKKQAKLKVKSK
ncbi:Hsp20/alpha crystallin family protein [bacterium]|nr:Hsp20/alpha crystallin family protein [bacterium]